MSGSPNSVRILALWETSCQICGRYCRNWVYSHRSEERCFRVSSRHWDAEQRCHRVSLLMCPLSNPEVFISAEKLKHRHRESERKKAMFPADFELLTKVSSVMCKNALQPTQISFNTAFWQLINRNLMKIQITGFCEPRFWSFLTQTQCLLKVRCITEILWALNGKNISYRQLRIKDSIQLLSMSTALGSPACVFEKFCAPFHILCLQRPYSRDSTWLPRTAVC